MFPLFSRRQPLSAQAIRGNSSCRETRRPGERRFKSATLKFGGNPSSAIQQAEFIIKTLATTPESIHITRRPTVQIVGTQLKAKKSCIKLVKVDITIGNTPASLTIVLPPSRGARYQLRVEGGISISYLSGGILIGDGNTRIHNSALQAQAHSAFRNLYEKILATLKENPENTLPAPA